MKVETLFSSATDNWSTPQEFYDVLNREKARAEAIREFAEKFEEALGDVFMVNHPCVSAIIDNLAKEMTEGEDVEKRSV